ncbi:MAG: spore coat protein [Bacillota bacterium]|nr:spore coat protein [Bacillota bacterium]
MKLKIPFITTNNDNAYQVNIGESYSLWDVLSAKYFALERLIILRTFAHDPDLKSIIATDIKDLENDVKIMEKALEKFGIAGANNHVLQPHSAVNAETFRDQFIAGEFFIFLQENIEMLLRALRLATSNDEVRDLFIKLVKDAINRADRMAQYLKIRGWIGVPPMYHNNTSGESIDNGEAYHLWNHLTYRYDNVYQTLLFASFTYDTDFKLFLEQGGKTLMKQSKMLEEELQRYGLPLPVRPPTVKPPETKTELMNDDYMFRALITGIQGALVFHAQGLKQSVTNNRLRSIFKDLLLDEVEIYHNLVKFGKMKGWLNAAPRAGTVK